MNVLMLTYYGQRTASSRYRFYYYVDLLAANGIHCDVHPFLDDPYLDYRFDPAQRKHFLPYVLRRSLRRVLELLLARKYDLVFLQYEGLPYLPPLISHFLRWQKIPYICDYDDAFYVRYEGHRSVVVRRLLGSKIGSIMRGADAVIVGNHYLKEYALAHNSEVHLIPTSVDLDRYPRVDPNDAEPGPFTIGWIGSNSTTKHLKEAESALKRFCRQTPNAQVVLIGASEMPLDIVPLIRLPWSESTEVEDLHRCHVGIMPLPDHAFERGKCGFKLIQYMACGLPTVASPVGENAHIVENGVTGFHAWTEEEWLEALGKLYRDVPLRRQMGEAGRTKAEANYSIRRNAVRLAEIIKETVEWRAKGKAHSGYAG